MNLEIRLADSESKTALINLKNFIDRASPEGLLETKISRAESKTGEMNAGDLLNSIKVVIEAASKPLVELVKCLQKYVDNFRTEIIIPHKKGNITIKYGKKISPAELSELINSILENQ